MSFINDFTVSGVQYVAVKFKRNAVRSQRRPMCSENVFVKHIS